MKALDDNADLDKGYVKFDLEVFGDLLVSGVKPTSMSLQATARRIYQEISLASVVAYGAPGEDASEYVRVSKYDLGAFEVLQTGPEEGADVAWVADISQIVPLNLDAH